MHHVFPCLQTNVVGRKIPTATIKMAGEINNWETSYRYLPRCSVCLVESTRQAHRGYPNPGGVWFVSTVIIEPGQAPAVVGGPRPRRRPLSIASPGQMHHLLHLSRNVRATVATVATVATWAARRLFSTWMWWVTSRSVAIGRKTVMFSIMLCLATDKEKKMTLGV